MDLSECFEGVTPEQVADQTGFPLDARRAKKAESPTETELYILTEQVDPLGLMAR